MDDKPPFPYKELRGIENHLRNTPDGDTIANIIKISLDEVDALRQRVSALEAQLGLDCANEK